MYSKTIIPKIFKADIVRASALYSRRGFKSVLQSLTCLSENFTFHLPVQSKVAAIGNSKSIWDFTVAVIFFKTEIIYDVVLSIAVLWKPNPFSLGKVELTARLLKPSLSINVNSQ